MGYIVSPAAADFALLASDVVRATFWSKTWYTPKSLFPSAIMLLRRQNPQANFEAMLEATQPFEEARPSHKLDIRRRAAVRAEAAMEVVEWAHRCASPRIVAFGIGGDEMSIATKEFQRACTNGPANYGLHRLMHAGEIGGPEKIREAIELLRVERIGHGIAAIQRLRADGLARRTSHPARNLPGKQSAHWRASANKCIPEANSQRSSHCCAFRHGIPVVLSTDDPAMFHTSLLQGIRTCRCDGAERSTNLPTRRTKLRIRLCLSDRKSAQKSASSQVSRVNSSAPRES